MGKKKDAAKAAKKRAKLEAREAEIRAELERRAVEKKAAKKKGKKSKAEKLIERAVIDEAPIPTDDAQAQVVADAKAERKKKRAEKDAIEFGSAIPQGLIDEIKKSKKKSKKRDAIVDPDTGETRPEVIAERQAEKLAETAKIDAEIKARLAKKREEREANAKPEPAKAADAREGESEADYQHRRLAEKEAARTVEIAEAAGLEVLSQVAEQVETEHGREFAVGTSTSESDFAIPSDATPFLESGRNGYKIIILDEDGNPDPRKVRQYTRVTTYVGNIDDETTLKEWKLRLLAEGLASQADEFIPRVSDIVHRRDVAVAKAEKADRKGKLGLGELARLTEAAKKEAKTALNALVEEATEAAGVSDAADAGTHLHDLAEIADSRGIDAVREMHENPGVGNPGAMLVTGNDLASIEAYVDAMTRMGAENIVSEAVIVNDAMRYAGRLDAIKFAKLPALIDPKTGEVVRPADQRRKRYVFDVKSGKIDFAAGKIARQLAAYAHGDLYDIPTGTRTPSGVTRDIAIVVHLPLGTGECHVYAVDLKEGHKLLKLSESVRAGRASGRKTINTAIDLAAPAVVNESEED